MTDTPIILGVAPKFNCYELLLALRFFVNMGPDLRRGVLLGVMVC